MSEKELQSLMQRARRSLRSARNLKGKVIRGGFGSTFGRIVCHANCREPEICELRNVCPYTALFQPFVPEGRRSSARTGIFPGLL